MDRRIRFVAGLVTVFLVAIALRAGYVQELRAEQIAASEPVSPTTGEIGRNPFRIFQECRWRRGAILSADGQTLADTVEVPGERRCTFERTYPSGDLVPHVVGQWSLHFGKTGLESAYNVDLVGDAEPPRTLSELFTNRPRVGRTVVSTIDTRLQQAALEALAGRRGGVVALVPSTGAVLVAASNPSYDPNLLASNDRAIASDARCELGVGEGCENLAAPLLSVALQSRRPPGSTFKVVTAAAALESGKYQPNSPRIGASSSYVPPGERQSIGNFGGGTCGGSLSDVLRTSCNTAFARIAVDIGADQLLTTAQAMGLDQISGERFADCNGLPRSEVAQTRTGCVPSQLASSENPQSLSSPGFLSRAGFGQWVIETSPFGMALVTGTIANDGFVPRPRFADRILDRTGTVTKEIRTGVGLQAISPSTAESLSEMMRKVTTSGTAAAAFSGGDVVVDGKRIQVAGKTGTAQQPSCSRDEVAVFGKGCGRLPHAWFIAFAPVERPTLAVAVLVERGGGNNEEATGGRLAAPIARRLFEEYFALYRGAAGDGS